MRCSFKKAGWGLFLALLIGAVVLAPGAKGSDAEVGPEVEADAIEPVIDIDTDEAVEEEDDLLPPAEVIVLDSKSFEHLTQASTGATTGDWFVKFYAPWCGHCRKLEPAWNQLAGVLTGVVNVAKVDVTKNKDLGTRFGIKGFPTLLFFHHGTMHKFSGPRNPENLEKFARGGFKGVEGVPVPKESSALKSVGDIFKVTAEDMKGLLQGKVPSVTTMIVLILAGFVVLSVVFAVIPAKKKPTEKTH